MRLPNANPVAMQRATSVFIAIQALMIPILMGVVGASLMQKNKAHSSTKYMFAMTWLTIPGLIYVGMTPRFPRTKPLSNPYAICGFNVIYCFLWFIAPIALGVYNSGAQERGLKQIKKNLPEGQKAPSKASCDTTISGVPKECSLNKAAVALGVFMFLFLFATSIIASYIAVYYHIHLITPMEAQSGVAGEQVTQHTKDAFETDDSANLQTGDYALIDEERLAHGGSNRGHGSVAGSSDIYDDDYERHMARQGEGDRSRSVGSGSYDVGRVGFPEGDYTYSQAGK
ncbi:hypothetical protein DFH27DRAFT_528161 [Peziza echinospora]|nr:hypothetical protein DFH27DRAFT_528161 [Peziza echinospora]